MVKKRRFSRGRFKRLRYKRRGGFRTKRLRKFIKRTVKRMQEIKYRTANVTTNVDGYTGYTATIVPTFPQGVDKYNRIGNRIQWKFIQLRLSLLALRNTSTTASSILVRIIIFQTITDLVPAATTTQDWSYLFDTTPSYVSSIKNNNVRIISDTTRWLGILDYADQSNIKSAMYLKKKWRQNNQVEFNNATEVVPTATKDQIYMTIIANRTATTQVNLTLAWQSRFSFYDL